MFFNIIEFRGEGDICDGHDYHSIESAVSDILGQKRSGSFAVVPADDRAQTLVIFTVV